MPLFVAQHHRSPETTTTMGEQLLECVSAAAAARYGVAIQAEAVIDAERTVILILRAPDRERVEAFMRCFERFGDVEVRYASSAEEAVQRGGCGAVHPSEPSGCVGRISA